MGGTGPMKDPMAAVLNAGAKHIDGALLGNDLQLEADVAVVGSGAGGGLAAEIFALAGLRVIIIEEGGLHTSSSFNMEERSAYPHLYQEAAGRRTMDGAISVLQGRCVGGGTTVNWTTSLRTPDNTLQHWQQAFGLKEHTSEALAPWFERVEQRLHIHPWAVPPNQNNALLAQGCEHLGWSHKVIPRNVMGCANLGYCGMGCPINAKQSMLVTTLPSAMDNGATLMSHMRVERLARERDRISTIHCRPLDRFGKARAEVSVQVRATQVVMAAGAIGTPAIIMRSSLPDPYGMVGKRTFLHPVLISGARFNEAVNGHSGAPQSVYSDQFLWPTAEEMGFKLEVPPLHPILIASKLVGFGQWHADVMADFNHLQVTLALLRDGFEEQSQGGHVVLSSDGAPRLDYPLNDYLWKSARNALLRMAELQFAAGATAVLPMHESAEMFPSWKKAQQAIKQLTMAPRQTTLTSAHVMGGCAMGNDAVSSVIDSDGRYHRLDNLWIMDGSMFPTSLGANPQLSIYAMVARNATRLAQQMTGQDHSSWPNLA
ncbi:MULTISPECIES: GMC family oxidoreductase [Corallincola]|uniref:GMC family oxidoreductase n=3 Tax=Corallincola TaxID=1775176 RepID=A0A368N2M5_9GAMM|nr:MULTISPECIES: GMC family oxidoreductase [Corallincola]RCU43781.1 GMC family oxidoreductase [Corallincola holothuriorum]TAA46896.1 GMC family oxidoreductase [Corallincola spongiicola]TCI04544.1 GMC family oxidoreductase [Corallincola luteus]